MRILLRVLKGFGKAKLHTCDRGTAELTTIAKSSKFHIWGETASQQFLAVSRMQLVLPTKTSEA